MLLFQFEPAFNNFVRRFAAHRLKVAEEEDDIAEIERRLFSGQIEELIEQAENELDLIVMANGHITYNTTQQQHDNHMHTTQHHHDGHIEEKGKGTFKQSIYTTRL